MSPIVRVALAASTAVMLLGCSGGGREHSASAPADTAGASSASRMTTAASATSTSTIAVTTPTAVAPTPSTAEQGAATAENPCGQVGSRPDRYDHVIWIWMENHTADAVLRSPAAPFERALASRCGSSSDYHSVGSPSLPNYLGATSGSTHGVHDDEAPAAHPVPGDNLFRQITVSGGTARSYEESMPHSCALTSSGRYAVKHNPQAYFSDSADRTACVEDDVPLGSIGGGPFMDDLSGSGLPTFSFVTPDLCHDTHDCDVAVGDAWLRDWLTAILRSATYAAGRTVIFVVWDEPTPMPLLVIAPSIPAGTTATVPFDHYSLLRTTEELLGLDVYLGQAAGATSMRTAFGM